LKPNIGMGGKWNPDGLLPQWKNPFHPPGGRRGSGREKSIRDPMDGRTPTRKELLGKLPSSDSEEFAEGLAAVKNAASGATPNSSGTWMIPPFFEEVTPFSAGKALVKSRGVWRYINRQGEELSESTHPFFSLERSECFGPCPVYSLIIAGDGR